MKTVLIVETLLLVGAVNCYLHIGNKVAHLGVTFNAHLKLGGLAARRESALFSVSKRGTRPSINGFKAEDLQQSLETLLEKQIEDVYETQKLLKELDERRPIDGTHHTADTDGFVFPDGVGSIISGTDYGFISRSEGVATPLTADENSPFEEYNPPTNIFSLGVQQFGRNFRALLGNYDDNTVLTSKQEQLRAQLKNLTLDIGAVWEREEASEPVSAPFILQVPYVVLCFFLDVVFEGRYAFSRFFFLETVARMPYFSYISMLHLYETLGLWRRSSDVKRVHFAEEWNEFHHLLIMESLGGDQDWWVRFMAQHSAVAYYFVLVALWALSPSLAYKFSELLETHAVHTYSQFLDENEDALKKLPPSSAAIEYYAYGFADPLFDEYQTTRYAEGGETRRPGMNMTSLYDVFSAIRDDEGDHVNTMKGCLDPDVAVQAPSVEKKLLFGAALVAGASTLLSGGEFSAFDTILSNPGGDMLTDLVATIRDGQADGTLLESISGAASGAVGAAGNAAGDALDTGALQEKAELFQAAAEQAASNAAEAEPVETQMVEPLLAGFALTEQARQYLGQLLEVLLKSIR